MRSHEHGDEFQSYESEHMKLQANGVRGRCYLVVRNNVSLTGPEEITSTNFAVETLQFAELELYLNL